MVTQLSNERFNLYSDVFAAVNLLHSLVPGGTWINCYVWSGSGSVKTDFFLVFVIAMFGISDHDLMYSQEAVESTELDNAPENEAIQARVRKL